MCSVCYGSGYGSCPACQDPYRYADCPRCDGTGIIYFDEEGEEIDKETYDTIPPEKRYEEMCMACSGDGYIDTHEL